MPNRICIIEGCDRKRNSAAGYCGTHLYRVKKYGDPEPTLAKRERQGLTCIIDECDSPRHSGIHGWCRKHHQRWLTHGDPHKTIITMGSGDNVTVSAIHKRLDATRGRARDHQCVDCGKDHGTRHWCYDHKDKDEKTSDHGPYSTDLDRYAVRCVPCHKRFDLKHLGRTGERICVIEGCGRKHCAKGLCKKHWKIQYKRRHDAANTAGHNIPGQTRQFE